MKESLIDRLVLNYRRIDEMVDACNEVVELKDPIGEVVDSYVREDGLKIYKIRVPLGVLSVIYESRPNVTVETTILALKSGNCILLKGGSDAINSNKAIVDVMKSALRKSNLPESAVELVEQTDRSVVDLFDKAARLYRPRHSTWWQISHRIRCAKFEGSSVGNGRRCMSYLRR